MGTAGKTCLCFLKCIALQLGKTHRWGWGPMKASFLTYLSPGLGGWEEEYKPSEAPLCSPPCGLGFLMAWWSQGI